MMREIKFRGKREDNGEWVIGKFLKLATPEEYFILPIGGDASPALFYDNYEETGKYIVEAVKVIPETVGQYTGLKDKNGVEIYEGDIVRLYERYLDESWKAVIVFGNCNSLYSWGWQLKPISKTSFNIDILLWVDTEDGTATCEVIGNIHDQEEDTNENTY